MQNHQTSRTAAAASFALAGIAAAFALASCCALPMLLASAGLGFVWLDYIGLSAASHRTFLLFVGAFCLGSGGIILVRQQFSALRCGPEDACAPFAMRASIFIGLVIGTVLLWLGYRYV